MADIIPIRTEPQKRARVYISLAADNKPDGYILHPPDSNEAGIFIDARTGEDALLELARALRQEGILKAAARPDNGSRQP